MKFPLVLGALCLALLSPVYLPVIQPAYAQEVTCYKYDALIGEAKSRGFPSIELTLDQLAEVLPEIAPDATDVTRGFMVQLPDGRVLVGLEKDGCLLDPIFIDPPKPAANTLSGKQPNGVVYALS